MEQSGRYILLIAVLAAWYGTAIDSEAESVEQGTGFGTSPRLCVHDSPTSKPGQVQIAGRLVKEVALSDKHRLSYLDNSSCLVPQVREWLAVTDCCSTCQIHCGVLFLKAHVRLQI